MQKMETANQILFQMLKFKLKKRFSGMFGGSGGISLDEYSNRRTEGFTWRQEDNKHSAGGGELGIYKPSKRSIGIASGDIAVVQEAPEHVVLYSHYASICSQRARLALVEKQVPFKAVMLHYDALEHMAPTYLGINPRGFVPTIIADGEVVFDSATIMPYVNNRYRGPDLMPGDDAQKAAIRQEIKTADAFPIRDLVARLGMLKAKKGATFSGWGSRTAPKMLKALESYQETYPEFAENYKRKFDDWSGQLSRVADEETIANTFEYVNRVMDAFDERLAGQDYIVGDQFTLADIAWMPVFIRLHHALDYPLWGDGQRPNLQRYFDERIKTRPGFKTAIVDNYYDNVVPPSLLG